VRSGREKTALPDWRGKSRKGTRWRDRRGRLRLEQAVAPRHHHCLLQPVQRKIFSHINDGQNGQGKQCESGPSHDELPIARATGETTCSSSACGAASNMRRCSCGPTKAYPRLALRSAATWTFVMAGVRTGALTAPRPIKPTSPRCHSAWQPNPGRGSTCRRGKSVQTTRTTCIDRSWPRCCPNS
jgi:hypothetical protein